MKYGLIAGNGRFPILALETARTLGHEVVAVGIEGEASKDIEALAARSYWVTIGEFGKLIDILKREGITEVIMAGQVKHVSLFSAIRPDWRLFKLLGSLRERNTDALIGGVAKVLADEGIQLGDSTRLLKPLLAGQRRAHPPQARRRRGARHPLRPPRRPTRSPASTSARALRSPSAPASPSKRWKARTRCCAAPPRW